MGKMRRVTGNLTLKGVGGQIAVEGDWLTIYRRGTFAKMNHGLKGEKRIPIKNILAVQVKKPGLTNGYIQFTLGGSKEDTRGVVAAATDENSVVFTSRQSDDAYAICNYVEYYIIHGKAPKEVSTEAAEDSSGVTGGSATRIPPPVQPAAPSAPPGWYPDPHARHELRYFDGGQWTHHVSDHGVQSSDPIN